MFIKDFLAALQAGKEISNATAWKDAQLITNKLTTLGLFVLTLARMLGYDYGLTDAQLVTLVSAVGVLVSVFNGTATVVSTARIGLRGSPKPGVDAGRGGVDSVDKQPVDQSPVEPNDAKPEFDADVFHTRDRG